MKQTLRSANAVDKPAAPPMQPVDDRLRSALYMLSRFVEQAMRQTTLPTETIALVRELSSVFNSRGATKRGWHLQLVKSVTRELKELAKHGDVSAAAEYVIQGVAGFALDAPPIFGELDAAIDGRDREDRELSKKQQAALDAAAKALGPRLENRGRQRTTWGVARSFAEALKVSGFPEKRSKAGF